MIRRASVVVLALLFGVPAALAAPPGLVILVRHAEKAALPADNPPLTPAGRERAAELAKAVEVLSANVPLRAIFSTDYVRTIETAKPLSQASHVPVTVVKGDLAPRVLAIAGGTVVIVGHSNTLPPIIEALGGPSGIVIGDAEFKHLYVLAAPGTTHAKLAALAYGK